MVSELRQREMEDIEFAVETYSDPATGKLDATYLGDVLRGLKLNPSLLTLEKLGQSKKSGTKFLTLDDVKAAYIECKKEIKEQGNYDEFVKCLKLYDKTYNGKLIADELSYSLLCLGEKLSEDQVDDLFRDCMPEEDEDGFVEYDTFLRKMCDKPVRE